MQTNGGPSADSTLNNSMFMAMRPKPPPATFSNKALNFYQSEYKRDGAQPLAHPADNAEAKGKTLNDPPFLMSNTLQGAMRTTAGSASGDAVSNLMSEI